MFTVAALIASGGVFAYNVRNYRPDVKLSKDTVIHGTGDVLVWSATLFALVIISVFV